MISTQCGMAEDAVKLRDTSIASADWKSKTAKGHIISAAGEILYRQKLLLVDYYTIYSKLLFRSKTRLFSVRSRP